MSDEQYQPTKAEFLAGLITGSSSFTSQMASVQRSHRFPLHLFMQIENMARLGGVPVSLIINQLIEVGLDAVSKELPEEVAQKVRTVTQEQTERKTVTESVEVKNVRTAKIRVSRQK